MEESRQLISLFIDDTSEFQNKTFIISLERDFFSTFQTVFFSLEGMMSNPLLSQDLLSQDGVFNAYFRGHHHMMISNGWHSSSYDDSIPFIFFISGKPVCITCHLRVKLGRFDHKYQYSIFLLVF